MYNNSFKGYAGNNSDNVHTTGCLRPGEKVEWGCESTIPDKPVPGNISKVKGYGGGGVINPTKVMNQTEEDCRQLALFIMGDYDKRSNNMSGLEPTICKKFRKIFKNAGFRTYLVNEFRTSKLCNCCHHEIEPFMIRQSHKPNDIKVNKKITVNGLLSHQEDKQKCEIIHNRDKNAVQNMLNIVKSIFTIGKRPDIFTRIHT